MSALALGLAFLAGGSDPDPFAHVINLLYNPGFLPRAELPHDAYAGPAPPATRTELCPGWFPEGALSAALDAAAAADPPYSLRVDTPARGGSVVSYAHTVAPGAFVVARAKIMAEGDVRGARIALRWFMADGSLRRTPSEPPGKERDFVEVRVSARPPEGALAVALAFEAAGDLRACRFDAPVLALAGPDVDIIPFPAGCHARGVREALVRTRMPLLAPATRITWDGGGKSLEVHPLRPHASGFYHYVVDFSILDRIAEYTLEVRDGAIEGRAARCRTAILADPYGAAGAKAAEHVLRTFTAARVRRDGMRAAAENLVLLGGVQAPTAAVRARIAELGAALLARLEGARDLAAPDAALCAWALASAGTAANDLAQIARARSLAREAWNGGTHATTPARAALCGAASLLAARDNDPLDRDCADDMAVDLVRTQLPSGLFPFPAGVVEQHWPVLALAGYARLFPDSTVTPRVETALDACTAGIERLCLPTPFGNAGAAGAEGREVDIPPWRAGTTLYLLSQAVSMCAHPRAEAAGRLAMHAERQVQFVLGFNPLGKALDLEKAESLRSSAGERVRPGEVMLGDAVDPLRANIYMMHVTASLAARLAEAERLWQEYERMRKERQAQER